MEMEGRKFSPVSSWTRHQGLLCVLGSNRGICMGFLSQFPFPTQAEACLCVLGRPCCTMFQVRIQELMVFEKIKAKASLWSEFQNLTGAPSAAKAPGMQDHQRYSTQDAEQLQERSWENPKGRCYYPWAKVDRNPLKSCQASKEQDSPATLSVSSQLYLYQHSPNQSVVAAQNNLEGFLIPKAY